MSPLVYSDFTTLHQQNQCETPTVNDRLKCSLKDILIWMDVDGNSSFNDTHVYIHTEYPQQMVI